MLLGGDRYYEKERGESYMVRRAVQFLLGRDREENGTQEKEREKR